MNKKYVSNSRRETHIIFSQLDNQRIGGSETTSYLTVFYYSCIQTINNKIMLLKGRRGGGCPPLIHSLVSASTPITKNFSFHSFALHPFKIQQKQHGGQHMVILPVLFLRPDGGVIVQEVRQVIWYQVLPGNAHVHWIPVLELLPQFATNKVNQIS